MGDRPGPLEMERTRLRNDLEVILQPAPASARSFSVTYLTPGGWGFDTPGVEGLALATGKLAVGRPGGRPREEVARLLDRYGGTLSSSVAPESGEITLWGPLDAWEPLLGLLADAVLRPRFARDELTKAQRQLRERQLRQSIQPDLRSERELLAGLFPPGHPYHSTGIGTIRSVGRLTGERLRRFHASHYSARGSLLVVTSGMPRAQTLRDLERRFSPVHLQPDPSPFRGPTAPVRPRRTDVAIEGQSQVSVCLGGRAGPRSDPEYPEWFLLNEVLGGRPLLSRLFQRVRERDGLAYHASSELEAMRWGGYWEAVAGTDPATRDRVVTLMRAEVERLSTELIPGPELDRIRESALGALPLELETTASAHELAVDVAYHHLPVDFYRAWPTVLRALTPRMLRAAAGGIFDVSRTAVVTAGPAIR